jgi:hypothetical protein
MSSAQDNTKIELVTESIEALVLATVISHASNGKQVGRHEAETIMQNITDARDVLRASLVELLKPTLRVVSDNGPRIPAERVPYDGMGIDGMNLA